MSDMLVPSWRPSQEKQVVSGRMLAVAGGLLGLVALGSAAAWGISRMGPRPVPVVEADPRPLKIRPESPGGTIVPNQDQLVLEGAAQRRAAERNRTTVAQFDAGPEAPALDLLRQYAAPSAADASSLGSPTPALVPPVAAIALATTVAAPAMGAVAPGRAAAAPSAGGRSYAQFGALASEEAARAEWDRLLRRVPELAGVQPRISKLERDGQPTLWRLRASGLADGAAAKALCDAARARGVAACVPSGGV